MPNVTLEGRVELLSLRQKIVLLEKEQRTGQTGGQGDPPSLLQCMPLSEPGTEGGSPRLHGVETNQAGHAGAARYTSDENITKLGISRSYL